MENEESVWDLWDTIKRGNLYIMSLRRRKKQTAYFKKK